MPDLWPYRPALGCRESLDFFSDTLGGRTAEERIALRPAPRQSFDYESRLLGNQQFARAKTFARRNGALPIYVPVWSEQVFLGVVGTSDTVLTFDTTWGDWRVGSFLVVWQDDETYEVCEIDTVTDTDITLTGAVGTNFTYAVVCPVRTAILTNGMAIQRGTIPNGVSASFLVTDNIDLAADYVTDFPQYQSLDVMTDPIALLTDVNETIIRAAEYVDSGLGPVAVEATKSYVDFGQTVSFHDARGPELWRRRLWVHSLRGKQKTFWLPTNNMDLDLQASFLSGATTISVKSIGPTAGYLNRHIMFHLTNGNRYFREITNASNAGANDTLTISSSLGVGVAPADISKLCFMSLVRLDSDKVEINHSYELCSVVSIPVMEVPG